MSSADNRGKNNKYMSKPKFSREKTFAYDADDIIKNEAKMELQKEERDNIRKHNLNVASGVIDDGEKDSSEVGKKPKKAKKAKTITEKKALEGAPGDNITVQNHYDLPDSDNDSN